MALDVRESASGGEGRIGRTGRMVGVWTRCRYVSRLVEGIAGATGSCATSNLEVTPARLRLDNYVHSYYYSVHKLEKYDLCT